MVTDRKIISPRLRATFHFFDLDIERWYAIPSIQVQQTWSCGPSEAMDQWFQQPRFDNVDPSFVIVVDQDNTNYKVFFFSRLKEMPLAYVRESGIQDWRPVGGLPCPMDNSIAFQNTVFASLIKGAVNLFPSS